MTFSQRKNIQPTEVPVQIDSMDSGLRNGLWSAISLNFVEPGSFYYVEKGNCRHEIVLKRLWHNYFKMPLDECPTSWPSLVAFIRERFFQFKWNEVYDFIECLIYSFDEKDENIVRGMTEFMNSVMERDNCGYRIVDGKVADLIDEHTIDSIENAANQNRFAGAATHITTSVRFLYDREDPDYRNSIKESISAVESACRDFTGDPKATLGKSIKKIEEMGYLHPVLKEALSKLYGYTSDESGIRHALIDHSAATKDDAVFMLSVCSAYINYLIAKSASRR